jgi:hypothetical protein
MNGRTGTIVVIATQLQSKEETQGIVEAITNPWFKSSKL